MVDGEIKFFYKGEEISAEKARAFAGAVVEQQEDRILLNYLAKEESKND